MSRGSGGMLHRKILKSRFSEMAFLRFGGRFYRIVNNVKPLPPTTNKYFMKRVLSYHTRRFFLRKNTIVNLRSDFKIAIHRRCINIQRIIIGTKAGGSAPFFLFLQSWGVGALAPLAPPPTPVPPPMTQVFRYSIQLRSFLRYFLCFVEKRLKRADSQQSNTIFGPGLACLQ